MSAGSVSDQFVATLAEAGVKRIYGLVGDSLNGLTDALQRHGAKAGSGIDWVPVRHEEVAAFAAGAEAQLTGMLAVCAGSCGPGNLHLINGLFDCHRSRVPVLAIAAQIPTPELGSGYFQETNPKALFADCSVYCENISSPEQMPRVLEIAIREAVAKRGVAVVVLPGDVALAKAAAAPPPNVANLLPGAAHAVPRTQDVARLGALLNEAKRVTILAGAGCAGAQPALLALAERLAAPVVHSLRGKEHVEPENPYDVGMTGLIGFSSGYYAMNDCDVLLMLGTDFPYRQFLPEEKDVRIAQVDLRGEQLGRRASVDLAVVGEVSATIDAVLPLLRPRDDKRHLERAVTHYREARAKLDREAYAVSDQGPIHPQTIAAVLSELADEDAIFTADVGLPTVWAARHVTMRGRRRLLASWWHGSMANAMAQAIGAQATFPGRQVISLSGDGGFAMLMGDFLTLAQLGLPVKVVIFDNSDLGYVELEQKAGGFIDTGTRLRNPDFALMAESAGIRGIRIVEPGAVREGLAAALAHPGPVLVDAVVNRQELAIPPKITAEMARGFTLYAAKAVLDGRTGDVIDLARSNLWR